MTAQINSTIPVLASLDLSESVAIYATRLGFKKLSLLKFGEPAL